MIDQATQKSKLALAPEGYRYWAFISYSHADKKIVDWLHSALEQYRFPKGIKDRIGAPLSKQLFPVFRDRDELPSSADLGQHLRQALIEARYLIVVCSPRSAKSMWVNEEVKTFKSMGRAHRVLCLIVDGEPNATDMPGLEHLECFPPAIRFEVAEDRSLLATRTEAIAADARKGRDGKRLALLKLIAGLAETNFADLVQRQDQRRARRLIALASFMFTLVIAFAIITWQAVTAKVQVEKLYRTALSRQLAHYADAPTNGDQNVATNILLGAIQANFVEPTMESRSSMLRSVLSTEKLHTVVQLPSASSGVAVSPNGKLLASANWDGSVSFINFSNLKQIHSPIIAHKEKVLAIAFSPDSRLLISGGVDQSIQLWNAQTGEPLNEKIHAHDGWVSAIKFLPDGNRFVTLGWDGTAKLWNTQQRQVVDVLLKTEDPLTSLALSSNGKYLALAGESDTIFIVDLEKKSKKIVKKAGGGIQTIAFSPDNLRLAVAGVDKKIDIFNIDTGRPSLPTMQGHQDGITGLAFTSDGIYLASSSWDKTVMIWDAVHGGQSTNILRGHGSQVTGLAFSTDNRYLISAGLDHSLMLWELDANSTLLKKMTGHDSEIRRIALSKDGKLMASVSWDGTVLLHNMSDQDQPPTQINLPNVNLYTAAFSPDAKLLALAGSDKKIYLWDMNTQHFRATPLIAHEAAILSLDFSPDGKLLVSGSWDGSILLWDMTKGIKLNLPPITQTGQVTSAVFSPDGHQLATAGDDESIALWALDQLDSAKPLEKRSLFGHSAMVTGLSYSHDGKLLASSSEDETVIVWDTDTHQQKGNILKLDSIVTSVAFNPTDKLLATGTVNGLVHLWDVDTRLLFGDPIPAHHGRIANLGFSPDGHWLMSGSYDTTLVGINLDDRIWKHRLCQIANRNLSKEEWHIAIGSYLTYQPVCEFNH